MNKLDDALRALEIERLKQGIEKRGAGIWRGMVDALKGSNVGAEVGKALVGAPAGAAVTAAGAAAYQGIRSAADSVFKAKHYKNMLGTAPGLQKNRDARKTQAAFNTLWNLNRGLAKDPLAAGSFVERSMNQAELSDSAGVYVDPQTATMLQKTAPKDDKWIMQGWMSGATGASGGGKKKRASAKMIDRYRKQFDRSRQ